MSLRNWSSLSSPAITVLILSIIEFAYTDWLDSSKNTKSPTTQQPRTLCSWYLIVTVVNMCAKNWHQLLNMVWICIYRLWLRNWFSSSITYSTTKNSMLINFTHLLIITVVNVRAKNWHRILSTYNDFRNAKSKENRT